MGLNELCQNSYFYFIFVLCDLHLNASLVSTHLWAEEWRLFLHSVSNEYCHFPLLSLIPACRGLSFLPRHWQENTEMIDGCIRESLPFFHQKKQEKPKRKWGKTHLPLPIYINTCPTTNIFIKQSKTTQQRRWRWKRSNKPPFLSFLRSISCLLASTFSPSTSLSPP